MLSASLCLTVLLNPVRRQCKDTKLVATMHVSAQRVYVSNQVNPIDYQPARCPRVTGARLSSSCRHVAHVP